MTVVVESLADVTGVASTSRRRIRVALDVTGVTEQELLLQDFADVDVKPVDGDIEVDLVPNSLIEPSGTSYIVTWSTGEQWRIVVPESEFVLKMSDLIVGTLPVPEQFALDIHSRKHGPGFHVPVQAEASDISVLTPAGWSSVEASGGYVHAQGSLASVWVVNHNLGFNAQPFVVDGIGDQIGGFNVSWPTVNTLTIGFNGRQVWGKAYVS